MSGPADVRTRITQALDTKIAPTLGFPPGLIEVVAFEQGVASLRLGPVCSACGTDVMSIVMSIEPELQRLVPEVEIVEAVN